MILAACGENEILPMNPEYPADIFTACLTSPIKMALKWFISTQLLHDKFNVNMVMEELNANNKQKGDGNKKNKKGHDGNGTGNESKKGGKESSEDKDKKYRHRFTKSASEMDMDGSTYLKKKKPANYNNYMALLDMIFDECIGGGPEDKKNILGELHWIFLTVTDTIAWNVLPNKLFQNLFRLDYTIQSLFRNYLLAERIMKSMNRNPISYPKLPPTHQHPMWAAWDAAVDAALLQLKDYVNKKNQWKYQQYQQLMQLKIQQQQQQQKHKQVSNHAKNRIVINDEHVLSGNDSDGKDEKENENENNNGNEMEMSMYHILRSFHRKQNLCQIIIIYWTKNQN